MSPIQLSLARPRPDDQTICGNEPHFDKHYSRYSFKRSSTSGRKEQGGVVCLRTAKSDESLHCICSACPLLAVATRLAIHFSSFALPCFCGLRRADPAIRPRPSTAAPLTITSVQQRGCCERAITTRTKLKASRPSASIASLDLTASTTSASKHPPRCSLLL